MRILIVISGLGWGGAERQVVLLSRELVRRGHAVLVYTLNDHVPRRDELAGSGVELVVDQKRWRVDPAVLLRLRRTVRRWGADLVHGFLYDGDFYARVACAGLRLPVLNSERGADRFGVLQRLGHRATALLFDGVVANSHSGAEFARRAHGIAEDRVHVVWNGIDLAEVDARLARSTRPARQMHPAGCRIVCVAGAIKPQKDHLLALDVCRELLDRDPRWRFVFVGERLRGGDAWEQRVLEHRRALGLERTATFTGVRTDVLEIMASSDVLLVTSHFEGFPNVVLEAMSCGTPVASTAYSDVRRILPNAWQIASRRSALELADIVERCAAEGEAVRRAQRRWVESHASLQRAAEALLAVYERYVRTPAALPDPAH